MSIHTLDVVLIFFFFFSSRRRHTRSLCDWSSDVCSSDLGGGIIHAELRHEERENVPTRVAHETVEHPLARDDGEVAVGAPVKRTRGAEIGPGALELDVLPDDPHDVRGLADLLDHVVGDEAHARNSTSVTPWPPWFGGANPKRFTRWSAERTSCTNSRRAPVPLPWITRR